MDILKARKRAKELEKGQPAPDVKPEKSAQPKAVPAEKAAASEKKAKSGKKTSKGKVKDTPIHKIPNGARSPEEMGFEPHDFVALPGTQDLPDLPEIPEEELSGSVSLGDLPDKSKKASSPEKVAEPAAKKEKIATAPAKTPEKPSEKDEETGTDEEGESDKSSSGEMPLEFLSFMIGEEEYGILLQRISEIIKPRPITEVPRMPHFVLGILTLRGVVIPVFDLATRLELGRVRLSKSCRIIIVNRKGEKVGLLVDHVKDVVRVLPQDIEPPPPVMTGVDMQFLEGVGRAEGGNGIRRSALEDGQEYEDKGKVETLEAAKRRLVILLNLERVASL